MNISAEINCQLSCYARQCCVYSWLVLTLCWMVLCGIVCLNTIKVCLETYSVV